MVQKHTLVVQKKCNNYALLHLRGAHYSSLGVQTNFHPLQKLTIHVIEQLAQQIPVLGGHWS